MYRVHRGGLVSRGASPVEQSTLVRTPANGARTMTVDDDAARPGPHSADGANPLPSPRFFGMSKTHQRWGTHDASKTQICHRSARGRAVVVHRRHDGPRALWRD